ncbi:MAG: thymidine kinase [Woeseia sp.]|nr:thymidine kinase [Woeseia sp.]MBT8097352.1 thymidine kinase [Woeseia sp.]NNE59540.1 thymidine kinase [Woeseia sp.]NNL54662.1 thymidine kinase [Woeseia sp.]
MAKVYFYYSSMNAGKSTALLQSSYNYRERGMNTLILAPGLDNRYGAGRVTSRIGLDAAAITFNGDENLHDVVSAAHKKKSLHCVLVDEAQFLSRDQVFQLCGVSDELNVPVLAYGLRTDFRGEPFEGSKYLLAWADNLKELKAICHCGRKATMVLRLDDEGHAIQQGSQVEIGGNDRYVSMCRRHFNEQFYRPVDADTIPVKLPAKLG